MMLKRITFGAWEKGDRKNLFPKAWLNLWGALRVFPGGDRVETRRGNAVWKALCAIADVTENGDKDSYSLKHGGGELLLERAEFDLLKKAWDKVRDTVGVGFSDEVIFVDDLLDHAEEISRDTVERALKAGEAAD